MSSGEDRKIENLKNFLKGEFDNPEDMVFVVQKNFTKLAHIGDYKVRTKGYLLEKIPVWVHPYMLFVLDLFEENPALRRPLLRRLEDTHKGPPTIEEMCEIEPRLFAEIVKETPWRLSYIEDYERTSRFEKFFDEGALDTDYLEELILSDRDGYNSNHDEFSDELLELFFTTSLNSGHLVWWALDVRETWQSRTRLEDLNNKPLFFSQYMVQVINSDGTVIINMGFDEDQVVGRSPLPSFYTRPILDYIQSSFGFSFNSHISLFLTGLDGNIFPNNAYFYKRKPSGFNLKSGRGR